jgi:hypothetical protein
VTQIEPHDYIAGVAAAHSLLLRSPLARCVTRNPLASIMVLATTQNCTMP